MRLCVRLTGAILLGLAVCSPTFAQVRNAAELFPAETLAYLEVHQPARITREVSSLVKGSALEDMAATLARFRERNKGKGELPWYELSSIGVFGLFLSPEMIAEAARFDGAAVAVTGISKEGPEVVAVLQTGTSNLPGLYLRAFLTVGPGAGSAVEVEGIPVYRTQSYDFAAAPGAGGRLQTRETDPSYALLPGALVIGTHDAVKGAVRRYKGKIADPGLTSLRLYKDLVRGRDRPGLHGFVDVGALAAQIDTALPASTPVIGLWKGLREFVNPQAVRSLGLAWTLSDGNLALTLRANLERGQASPLLEMLAEGKADSGWLHAVPRNSLLSLGVPWTDGAARFERIVQSLDAVNRAANGPDALQPSTQVAWLEGQLKVSLAKDLLGKVNHVGLAVSPRGRPLFVLTGKDADAAKAMAERLGGTEEKVAGRAVHSLPLPSPWGEKLCSAPEGGTLLVGFNAEDVAGGADGVAGKKGVLADSGYAESIKSAGSPAAVGTASVGQALVAVTNVGELYASPVVRGPAARPAPAAEPAGVKEMAAAVESLPQGLLVLRRSPELLTLEFRQPELKKVSAKALTVLVESSLERTVRARERMNVLPGVRPAPPAP